MSTQDERVNRLATRLRDLEAERRQAVADGKHRVAEDLRRTIVGLLAEALTSDLRLLTQRWLDEADLTGTEKIHA